MRLARNSLRALRAVSVALAELVALVWYALNLPYDVAAARGAR